MEWTRRAASDSMYLLHGTQEDRKQLEAGITPLYLGLELEIEVPSGEMRAVRTLSGQQRFVGDVGTDGSLNHGLEVRLHPLTFNWITTYAEDLTRYLDTLRNQHGVRAYETDTCGGHIHLSKDAFTGDQAYRWLRLIYKKENRDSWRMIARRRRSSMRTWSPFELKDDSEHALQEKIRYGGYRGAVCVQAHTFEFRLFKGTTNPNGVRKNFELCQATFEFSKNRPEAEQNVPAFRAWVDERKDTFTRLQSFMERRKVGVPEEVTPAAAAV